MWRESRVGLEAAALLRSPVCAARACRRATAAPVLLVPGFLAGDGSLATMTQWLRANGWRTSAPASARTSAARRRPARAWRSAWRRSPSAPGRRVVIVGQSRGGVFAEALRVRRPDLVTGIVTLGSPLRSQLAVHPLVLAQIGLVGALGTGRVPGLSRALPARRVLRALPRRLCATLPARGRLRRRSTPARTASSTGAPAWTRAPTSTSRSAPRTAAWASTRTPTARSRRARTRSPTTRATSRLAPCSAWIRRIIVDASASWCEPGAIGRASMRRTYRGSPADRSWRGPRRRGAAENPWHPGFVDASRPRRARPHTDGAARGRRPAGSRRSRPRSPARRQRRPATRSAPVASD